MSFSNKSTQKINKKEDYEQENMKDIERVSRYKVDWGFGSV